jgi:hypothetical protein
MMSTGESRMVVRILNFQIRIFKFYHTHCVLSLPLVHAHALSLSAHSYRLGSDSSSKTLTAVRALYLI